MKTRLSIVSDYTTSLTPNLVASQKILTANYHFATERRRRTLAGDQHELAAFPKALVVDLLKSTPP